MYSNKKKYPKSPYNANKQFAQLTIYNKHHDIQLDDELFTKPVLKTVPPNKNEYNIQLNSKYEYQKRTREIRYQQFMMNSEIDVVPNNTKVERNDQLPKNHTIPQYFKWCSCHVYKSDKKQLNDVSCYSTCESHSRNT